MEIRARPKGLIFVPKMKEEQHGNSSSLHSRSSHGACDRMPDTDQKTVEKG